ncbi:Ig-like domain-containing protein [Caballeronia sordidicola]|uniref:T1SS secreted agglutinin RTX n=1 Tax=Caballeronia sordidicola TaxID=196367 RepID=A0A226WX18_CABSO|nr:Ig-like domain-containing protein [Caballeronia sordidicola]OXC75742.1 T1SS secreted agglutinin RTX [Caballeronia sordidicola]
MLTQTQTPTTPVITSVGHASMGNVADSNQPLVTGTGDAGDLIMLYDGIRLLGTAVVSIDGTWSLTPVTALKVGTHTITALAENVETGAGSNSSIPFTSIIAAGVVVPNPPTISDVTDAVGPVTGPIPQNGSTDDPQPVIHGAGDAGSVITVYDGPVMLGTTTVNTEGKWSFQPTGPLLDGPHEITAKETTAGGTSGPSAPFDFNVDTTVPPEPDITSVTDDVGPVTGPVDKGGTTDDNEPVIAGTGVAGYTINLYDNGLWLGSAKVDGSGNWSFKPSTPLADGAHDITVTQTNPATGATSATPVVDEATSNHLDDQAMVSAVADLSATDDATQHHTVVGEHDSFVGTTGHDTVDLSADASTYFKESTAHIQGSTAHPAELAGATPAVNVLHLTGDHQVLDLNSLSGKTSTAKISGIEVIDLGGHANNLKLSLTDVLNLGEQDLFQKDGKQQMMVNGSNGDTVDLSNAHIAGVTDGQWQQHGSAEVGGVSYNVYEHSGAHTELLVQQGVQITMHG